MSDFTFTLERTPLPWYYGPFKIRLTDNRSGECHRENPDGPERFRHDFLLLLRYEAMFKGGRGSESDLAELRHHLCDAENGFGIRFEPNDTENLVLEWDITKGRTPTESVKCFVELLLMAAGAATVEHEMYDLDALTDVQIDSWGTPR